MTDHDTIRTNPPVDLSDAATVERLTARARRDAVALGGRQEDGEDAVAEVFLRCLTDPKPLASEALFRVVVVRKLRDIVRTSRRRREASIEQLGSGLDGEAHLDAAEAVLMKRGHYEAETGEEILLERERAERNARRARGLGSRLDKENALTRAAIVAYANEGLHRKVKEADGPARLEPRNDADDADLDEIADIFDLGEAVSIEQLAERNGVSWSALYFKARRARARIRKELEPEL